MKQGESETKQHRQNLTSFQSQQFPPALHDVFIIPLNVTGFFAPAGLENQ